MQEARNSVTLSPALDSGGDTVVIVSREERERETASFLVKDYKILYCTPVILGMPRSGGGGVAGNSKLALSTSFLPGLLSFGSPKSLRGLDIWGKGNVLIMSLLQAGVPRDQI